MADNNEVVQGVEVEVKDSKVKEKKYSSAADEVIALDIQLKKEQLQELALQREERKYSLQDLQQRLNDRSIKEQQKREDRQAQGRTFASQHATDKQRWSQCTHKKGGTVTPQDMRVLSTGGNGQQHAVVKHQMINGDVWVRCLRCGNTWSPPVKSKFYFKNGIEMPIHLGVFDEVRFEKAVLAYQRAVQFETNNTSSSSVVCRFSRYDNDSKQWVDASQDYREAVADTNLR